MKHKLKIIQIIQHLKIKLEEIIINGLKKDFFLGEVSGAIEIYSLPILKG